MILTKSAIMREIKLGNLKIEPFDESAIGAGSVDLTLDNKFRIFKKRRGVYNATENASHEEITSFKEADKLILKPKELVLGITVEKITLPENICGWLQGRSTFARLGLLVHISAPFMQPGISNKQVLEIYNASTIPIAIYPGTKICQFIFERTEGRATYKGKFANQEKP
ncbi:dCTP deaminase [Nanoarchaeota archaeon]